MIVIAIYLVFQQWRSRDLQNYLDLLHNSIAEMIINDKDRAEFEKYFADFEKRLDENELDSKSIEKLADNIINLKIQKDSLSKKDIQTIIPPKAPVTQSSFFSSLNIFSNNTQKQDWRKQQIQFQKLVVKSDSLRLAIEEQENLKNLVEQQIQFHANATKVLKEQSTDAKEKFKKLKNKIADSLSNSYLSKKDEKALKLLIMRLTQDNVAILNKINSIEELQNFLDEEKKVLETKLARIDSLKSIN